MGNDAKRTPWHTGTVDIVERIEPDKTLRVVDGHRVYNARGELVADCGAYDGSDSYAAFIVRVVNAHDDLVAACEKFSGSHDYHPDSGDSEAWVDPQDWEEFDMVVAKAKGANDEAR